MKDQSIPLVSVIVCFFNEKAFLAEAVESIMLQSYTNWEAILVDDGSNDGSTATAKKYAERNPGKIIYIDHPEHANRGLSFSRNCAIAIARGNLITILDADDIWLVDYLKMQVKFMTANPKVAMLCEATVYWYYNLPDKSKQHQIIRVGKEQDRLFEPVEILDHLYPLSDGHAPCLCGIIVRKDIIIKHGGFESQFTGMYEDQAFLIKIYLNEHIYISSSCNNYYRQRRGSLTWTNRNEGKYHDIRKEFLEWMEQYLKKNNFRQRKIKRLLKKAFEPYRQPIKHSLKIFLFRKYNGLLRRLQLAKK